MKHLGIPLSKEPAEAATALYTAIVQKMELRIARWSGFRLSLLGRAYVAKLMLASMVVYHVTFIPIPEHLLTGLCRALHTASQQTCQSSAAHRRHCFPARTPASAEKDGGISLVDIRSQISALQAKVIGRLLEPQQLA